MLWFNEKPYQCDGSDVIDLGEFLPESSRIPLTSAKVRWDTKEKDNAR